MSDAMFFGTEDEIVEVRPCDIWQKFGGSFRCGCCGKMPTFVDIRDWRTCPHCEHVMKWYETAYGLEPMPPVSKDAWKPSPNRYVY